MSNVESKPEVQFSCLRCGTCCSLYQVYIKRSEAKELAAHLRINPGEFLSSYTDPRWPGEETFLIRHQNGACVFLDRRGNNITRCLIYAFRPQDCRSWIPEINRPECRKGLSAWGVQ